MNNFWIWLILCVICVGIFSMIYILLSYTHLIKLLSMFDGGVIGVVITIVVSGLLANYSEGV